jgi:hypothetical protein
VNPCHRHWHPQSTGAYQLTNLLFSSFFSLSSPRISSAVLCSFAGAPLFSFYLLTSSSSSSSSSSLISATSTKTSLLPYFLPSFLPSSLTSFAWHFHTFSTIFSRLNKQYDSYLSQTFLHSYFISRILIPLAKASYKQQSNVFKLHFIYHTIIHNVFFKTSYLN